MSKPSDLKIFTLILPAWLAFTASVHATVFVKANNSNLLNDPNSWVAVALPGSGDIAQWDSTVAAANSVGLGAPTTWAGIILNAPGGLVTITNDGNSLTLGANSIDLSVTNNGLTLNCPLKISANQIWTVTNSRTLTINSPVNDSGSGFGITKNGNGGVTLAGTNTFSGPIVLNGGTLTLGNSNAWPGAASLSFKGGTLAINSGIIVTNLSIITTNTAASANVSCSGILPNNITLNAGNGPASPNVNATPLVTNGWLQVNLSGSVAAGGYITNNGTLVLNSASTPTLGTLVGSGGLGGIQDKATPAGGHTLTFLDGSYFSYYQPFSNSISPTVLQITGNGSVAFRWFGYNDAAGIVYTNILNGGNWTFDSVGQNNSSCHWGGTCILSNGATVIVTNNIGYVHGTWSAVSNSTLSFVQGTTGLNAGHAANNIGMNLVANTAGSIFTGNSLNLGFGQTTPNTAPTSNSLNVGAGGTVAVTNNLTLGVVGENKFAETDSVNLSGGKLLVMGTFAAAAGTLAPQTNASPYAVVYPANIFNWTGGQLTAATISVSNGVAISTLTNSTPTSISVTNPAILSGNFSSTALTNTAGVLAPGDDGIPGRTLINNGGYVQTDGGTLAIDLGGTTRASSFQASVTGFYDYLQAAGPVVLGGSLKVKLVGGYVPAYTDQLNIISTTGGGNLISGTFTNLISGGGNLGRVPVDGVPGAYFSVVTNSSISTLYLINYTNLTSTASYPTNITANVINGGTTLALSWPTTHLGWTLQAQTNSLNVGLTTNGWVDVLGTASVTSTNMPIVPSNPTVFFRLRN